MVVKNMGKYKLERKSFKQIIGNILVIASLIPIGTSGFGIYKFFKRNNDAISQTTAIERTINDEYEELTPEQAEIVVNEEDIMPNEQEEHINKYNFEELRQINPDIIGVIEGDCFANGYYPIVSSTSYDDINQKLYQNLEGEYSTAGLIIADPENDANMHGITRIWGHHFASEENAGLMFSSLVNYDSQEYYESHKTLKLYTENGEYLLEVFACIKDNPLNQQIGLLSEEEIKENIDDVKARSYIQTDTNLSNDSNDIIVLSTCTKNGSAYDGDIRLSVYAVKTPIWENVKTNNKTK